MQVTDEKTKAVTSVTRYLKVSPQDLNANVKINSQTRYIGIFKVPVFTADFTLLGSFNKLQGAAPDNLKLNEAFITLELNDLKGMSASPVFNWNGAAREFEPSTAGLPLKVDIPRFTEHDAMLSAKHYRRSNDNAALKTLSAGVNFKNDTNTFEIKFSLKGSEAISFIPVAKNNTFTITSDWANPNFSGNFLPDTREVSENGFTAAWNISYLASGIPATHLERADLSAAVFTITLLVPVDNYRNAERATKYGILFIVLTFLACFITEITSKKPVHAFQYLLVGGALAVFYILLLSFCLT